MASYMGQWRERHKGTATYFENLAWEGMQKAASNGLYPQKYRFSYKKGIKIDMTRDEFKSWCLKMRDVIEGLYRSGERPTLRRIDPSKNFSIENLVVGTSKTTKLGAVQKKNLPKKVSRVRVIKSKIKTFLKGMFK